MLFRFIFNKALSHFIVIYTDLIILFQSYHTKPIHVGLLEPLMTGHFNEKHLYNNS